MVAVEPAESPIPWILCGPGDPPLRIGDSAGSTATICTLGLRSFSTCPTPVIVPPVPIPATTMSTPPSVSAQISSAVVRRWMAGLASLANWRARTAPGRSAATASALFTAPFMPSAPGVRMSSAPKARRSARRSFDMVSGIVSTTSYPRAAPTIASAIPVLPLVASTIVPPGPSDPSASAASMIETPIRSLTELAGL